MLRVLELARDEDAPSDVVVMALADCLATIAITLENRGDYQPLERRLDSFIAATQEKYRRLRLSVPGGPLVLAKFN